MNKEEKRSLIEARIIAALQPESLNVIDESDQHVGHAGHQGGGRHFAVEITSSKLAPLPRIQAHRQIYALFDDLMPEEIHALRIKIK